jgi:hypothetical protein
MVKSQATQAAAAAQPRHKIKGIPRTKGARNDHNKKQEDCLGMPVSRANWRLRKLLLFRCLQRLGEDFCHHCGEQITDPDELSVHHIKPWRYDRPDLFWDLGNCTFSHMRCNKVDRPHRPVKKNPSAPGMHWCSRCRVLRPVGDFSPCYLRRSRKNNGSAWCRSCSQERRRRTVAERQATGLCKCGKSPRPGCQLCERCGARSRRQYYDRMAQDRPGRPVQKRVG